MKKFISLLLCLVCMFSLTGCFSDLLSLFETGDMEPEDVVAKMQVHLDDTNTMKDQISIKIEYDEEFYNYVVTFWSKDMGDISVAAVRLAYKNRNIEGASTVINTWETLTESTKEMSKNIEAGIRKLDKDGIVVVNLVNADNHEDILISASGGVILENIMDLY